VVAKVRERLAVSKEAAQKSDGERFNLKELKELEVKEKYQIEITKRFAALEGLDGDEDINRTWENIKENIKTSAIELKQHKQWFDEECLGFLDQRRQAKMQWKQYPSQSNVDNLNNVRRNASRHFRNKKKVFLKAKIEELESNNNINKVRDLCRSINDYTKGYQARTIIVKDEKVDVVADSHSIMVRWRNYFFQLLNLHGVKDNGQVEIHTAEPLVPETSDFEFELAIEKLKKLQITRF
jgi:hypothetical protein